MSHDADIAPVNHDPVADASSPIACRSRLIRVISAGSPSPSMNSTPSSCSAAGSFRSSAPSNGLNATRTDGAAVSQRSASARQRASVALQDHGLLAGSAGIELLVLAVKPRQVENRVQQLRRARSEPGRRDVG